MNGFCVYPNQCKCMNGYQFKFGSTNECEAICENCTDGTCVAPNLCKCFDGFEMNENVCEKICRPECVSGDCVNGTCVCDDGLQIVDGICADVTTTTEFEDFFDENDQYSTPSKNGECNGINNCKPICGNEGCANGTCISTGVCKCLEGFHPSSSFVCVLDNITAIESAPVKAVMSNYISIILAMLIVALMAVILIILLLNRRNCKVNYNVDEKGKGSNKLANE